MTDALHHRPAIDDSVDHSGGQLTIDTPEQVSIRFPIAGMGSRFLAILIDTLLQVAAYGALVLVFILVLSAAPKGAAGELSRAGEKWLVAGLILVHPPDSSGPAPAASNRPGASHPQPALEQGGWPADPPVTGTTGHPPDSARCAHWPR